MRSAGVRDYMSKFVLTYFIKISMVETQVSNRMSMFQGYNAFRRDYFLLKRIGEI